MLFNSFKYLVFFILVFILNFTLTKKTRWIMLLLASYYFYMSWKAEYLILILITTLTTYTSGILIEKNRTRPARMKFYLLANLFLNLAILFIFKYFNFISLSLSKLLSSFKLYQSPLSLKFMLPVGISFYSFQAIGYTVDVYRGEIEAERHLGIFALFLVFFPQLVAGPIERSKNLLPQFRQEKEFSLESLKTGFILIVWGMFKKVAIADVIASMIDPVYDNLTNFKGLALIIPGLLFSFQLFCDFSGYSDIARGSARILGFDLMENFDRPFLSKTVQDFWRRWHISLSSWFKDYVYIPLGGSRAGRAGQIKNQLIVFAVSGLWHGASWNFVAWGLFNGIFLSLGILSSNIRKSLDEKIGSDILLDLVRIIRTYLIFALSLVFFRTKTMAEAFYMLGNLFKALGQVSLGGAIYQIGISKIEFLSIMLSIFLLMLFQVLFKEEGIDGYIGRRPIVVRYIFYFVFIFYTILLGGHGCEEASQFIYFQF